MALAQQCAQSLERARLYEAEQNARELAEEAQQRLSFLAEASAILATSLDPQHTLGKIADLIVPALADVRPWVSFMMMRGLNAAHSHIAPQGGVFHNYELFPVIQFPLGIGAVIRRPTESPSYSLRGTGPLRRMRGSGSLSAPL